MMKEIESVKIFDQMDKLLDFDNDDVEGGLFDSEAVDFDSFPPVWMEESFTNDALESCIKPSHRTAPNDGMVQLEWLSNLFQDSLSKVKTLPICHVKRARSKRPRPATFNPRLAIHLIPSKYFRDSQNEDPNSNALRKCMHCETTSTPLWRAGPDKSNLCNACGLSYNKSGKLFPKYRPIASPSFDPRLHTNSYRKKREPFKSNPPQYLSDFLPLKKRLTQPQKQQECQEIKAQPFSAATQIPVPPLHPNSQKSDIQLILPQYFGDSQLLKKRPVQAKKEQEKINHDQNEGPSDIQLILPNCSGNSQSLRKKLQPLRKKLVRTKKEENKINRNQHEGPNDIQLTLPIDIQLILPKYFGESQPLKKKLAQPKKEETKIIHNQNEGLNEIQLVLPKYFGDSPPLKKNLVQPERELKKVKRNQSRSPNANLPRKCTHCEITKTAQWRQGPNGRRTLCNACGLRYKAGRLFPEYRPASSPTFVPSLHSYSHKKVIEMRNIKKCDEISGDLNSHKEGLEIRKWAASMNESETLTDGSSFLPVSLLDTTTINEMTSPSCQAEFLRKSDIVSQPN